MTITDDKKFCFFLTFYSLNGFWCAKLSRKLIELIFAFQRKFSTVFCWLKIELNEINFGNDINVFFWILNTVGGLFAIWFSFWHTENNLLSASVKPSENIRKIESTKRTGSFDILLDIKANHFALSHLFICHLNKKKTKSDLKVTTSNE